MSVNEYNKRVLKAGINFILEERKTEILQSDLLAYVKGDMETLEASLREWQSLGVLEVLKGPKECRPDDVCVRVFRFIDQKSPIPGWLNSE